MKLASTTILFLFCYCINAQMVFPYNDFDVDSIKSYEYIEGDSINGEIYDLRIMNYLNSNEREVDEYSFQEGARELTIQSQENINANGDPTFAKRNYLSVWSPNTESIEDLAYNDQGKLISRKYISIGEFSQKDLWTYANFDQNNNYTTFKIFHIDDFDVPQLFRYYQIEHTYTSPNLDSIYTYDLDFNTNNSKLENICILKFDADGKVTSEELQYVDALGAKRIVYKYEYSYNEQGLVDQFVYNDGIGNTADPWDTEIFYTVNYIYDNLDRVIQERYYKGKDNDEKYLAETVDYYRSSGQSSTQELKSLNLDLLWTNYDFQQLNLQLDKLEASKEYTLQLVNAQGQNVFTDKLFNHTAWTKEFNLTPGTYFFEVVSSSQERMVEKMIVH